MTAPLREAWDKAAARLNSTVENGNGHKPIKAARTRFENAHRKYWDACRGALEDVRSGTPIDEAADAHGVEALDVAELL